MSILLLLVALLAAGTLGSAYYGWALSTLWGWFVVPIFHLPYLTTWQAAGLLLVWSMLNRDMLNSLASNVKEGGTEALLTSIITGFIAPVLALSLGWVIRAFLW